MVGSDLKVSWIVVWVKAFFFYDRAGRVYAYPEASEVVVEVEVSATVSFAAFRFNSVA